MAETYWTGSGTANDFDDADNWSGSAPSSGDTAIIAATDDSIDDATVTSVYSKLRVGSSFTGSIGTDVVGGQNALATGNTLAELDYNSKAKAALKGTITSVVLSDVSSASDGFKFYGTTADFQILGGNGTVTLEAAASITSTLEVLGADSVKLEVDASATLAGTFIMDGGRVTIASGHSGTLKVRGGTLTLTGGNFGTIEITGGGVVKDERTATSSITSVTVYDGTFDGSGASGDVMTMGTLTIYADGVFDERTGVLAWDYTNPIAYEGTGLVYYDTGRTISQ